MAIALGFPIVRYDFFVLFGAHNRYILQFQVGSVRFEENGYIVATLLILQGIQQVGPFPAENASFTQLPVIKLKSHERKPPKTCTFCIK